MRNNTNLTIKWRKDFVGNFFVKKEGNAKYSSATWSIPDVLHGEIGRKITSFYSQFGISIRMPYANNLTPKNNRP